MIILLISVSNVFNGSLRITNREWEKDLGDKTSQRFKTLSKEIELDFEKMFQENLPTSLDKKSVNVKVSQFTPGSVIVDYTVNDEDNHFR